jgi:hypothetical protein
LFGRSVVAAAKPLSKDGCECYFVSVYEPLVARAAARITR